MDTPRELGKQKNMLDDIYGGAISRFSNPVNLKRLVNLIDETEWTSLNVDVKEVLHRLVVEASQRLDLEEQRLAGRFVDRGTGAGSSPPNLPFQKDDQCRISESSTSPPV